LPKYGRGKRPVKKSLNMTAKNREIQIIQFPPGEIEPLFIAARDVPKVIIGVSPKTWANWRSLRIGPEYHLIGGSVYYELKVLKKFFSGGLVKTTGGLDSKE